MWNYNNGVDFYGNLKTGNGRSQMQNGDLNVEKPEGTHIHKQMFVFVIWVSCNSRSKQPQQYKCCCCCCRCCQPKQRLQQKPIDNNAHPKGVCRSVGVACISFIIRLHFIDDFVFEIIVCTSNRLLNWVDFAAAAMLLVASLLWVARLICFAIDASLRCGFFCFCHLMLMRCVAFLRQMSFVMSCGANIMTNRRRCNGCQASMTTSKLRQLNVCVCVCVCVCVMRRRWQWLLSANVPKPFWKFLLFLILHL